MLGYVIAGLALASVAVGAGVAVWWSCTFGTMLTADVLPPAEIKREARIRRTSLLLVGAGFALAGAYFVLAGGRV